MGRLHGFRKKRNRLNAAVGRQLEMQRGLQGMGCLRCLSKRRSHLHAIRQVVEGARRIAQDGLPACVHVG